MCMRDRQEGGAREPSGGGRTERWQAHVGAGQVTEGTRRRYRQGREGKGRAMLTETRRLSSSAARLGSTGRGQ